MKILQVCFRMPFPLKDGGAIAMFNLLKGLSESGVDLHVLVPVTNKHSMDVADLPKEIRNMARFYSQKIDSSVSWLGAFLNLFSPRPYYLSRYYNKAFGNKLRFLLESEEFDIVILESLKVSMYEPLIRRSSNAKVVLRSHNVEHLIWDRLAAGSSGPKKYYLDNMVRKLRNYELQCMNNFDLLLAITEVDASFFRDHRCSIPLAVLPSGIDFRKFKADFAKVKPRSLFVLSAMDWVPNQEAVRWFVRDVWPLITKKYPGLTLEIAGRNMPESIKKIESEGVEIVGEVEDALEFMNNREIMLIPLRSGSGMRIKVVEGMALGKAIISTSIGAEGIDCEHGKNILLANTPSEFLEAVSLLLENPAQSRKLGDAAIRLVREEYDNDMLMDHLQEQFENLLKSAKLTDK